MKAAEEKNSGLPIPIYEIAFLQAYLYEAFSIEGHCKQNFDRTEWHLKETHNEEEVKSIIEYFKNNGLICDCDIIHKFDLRKYSREKIQYHEWVYHY